MQIIAFILSTALLLFIHSSVLATNLVPNPGFENCQAFCGIYNNTPLGGNWSSSGGSPDLYFTNISPSCFNYIPTSGNTYQGPIGLKGDEIPQSGNVMAGIGSYTINGANQREYIKTKLMTPMVVGKSYIVEFYISHADYTESYIDRFGIYFSDTPVPYSGNSTNNVLSVTPQVTASINQLNQSVGWVKISDTIVATAAYEYMVVGNFYNDANTTTTSNNNNTGLPGTYGAYYFVDNFNVYEYTPSTPVLDLVLNNIKDTICMGTATGSIDVSASGGTGNYVYQWSNSANASTINNLIAGIYTITVSDGVSTLYDTFDIVGITPPTLNATIGTLIDKRDTILLGEQTILYANTTNAQQFVWVNNPLGTFVDSNLNNPTVSILANTIGTASYVLSATFVSNNISCIVEDSVWLTVESLGYWGLPDAFTPEEADNNNIFRPIGLAPASINQFLIYNRFGQVVYDGKNNDNLGWDGRLNGVPQPREVYIYILQYQEAQQTKTTRGQLTLLR